MIFVFPTQPMPVQFSVLQMHAKHNTYRTFIEMCKQMKRKLKLKQNKTMHMNDAIQAKQIKYKYNIWSMKTKTLYQKNDSEREGEYGMKKKIAPDLRVKSIQSYE